MMARLKKATRPDGQGPITLAFVEGRWLIIRSQGEPAAGGIPASPYEIELWHELEAARKEIAELRAQLEQRSDHE